MARHLLGTLLRTESVNKEYIAFLHSLGMTTCQLCRVNHQYLSGEDGKIRSTELVELLQAFAMPPCSLFLHAPGGIVNPKLRTNNMLHIARQMRWAKQYGIALLACHIGEVPESKDEFYYQFIGDLQELAHLAEECQQQFLFETGPMRVEWLQEILTDAGSDALGINFDPANMLIYNLPNSPRQMIAALAARIKVMHCKDAVRPPAGESRGKETVLGQGETEFAEVLPLLFAAGFTGPLIIEREIPIGPEQRRDITQAMTLLQALNQD